MSLTYFHEFVTGLQALEASDQLRQRTAWALFQIFVVSSTTVFIQTKQWLLYYDIFRRNGFGGLLAGDAEITFSPVYRLAHPHR